MNFDFRKMPKDINIIMIEMIEKSKYSFAIKMKSKFINFEKISKKSVSKKNLISKSKNTKTKFEKKIQILKSLIENLYKKFLKTIKHVQ